MTAQCSIGTIHLHVTIPFMTCREASMKRVVIEASLAKFQIEAAADVTRSLRIAIETTIQANTLQVATLYIRCHRIHLIRTGIKDLHAVNGGRQAFRLHVVHNWLPSI